MVLNIALSWFRKARGNPALKICHNIWRRVTIKGGMSCVEGEHHNFFFEKKKETYTKY